MSPISVSGPTYLRAIDGLRFYAVFAVILFHQFFPPFVFGWAGVWLFFVISGFVITRSLITMRDQELRLPTAVALFYSKRALRILPLYVLFLTIGTALFLYMKSYDYLEQLPWLGSFTYNFCRTSPSCLDNPMFGHLWSLSVEEQFYLIHPLLILTLRDRRRITPVLFGILLLAPAVRALTGALGFHTFMDLSSAGKAVYMFSPGHFDAFAAGALLALYEPELRTLSGRRLLRAGWVASAVAGAVYFAACLAVGCGSERPKLILRDSVSLWVFGPFQHIVLYDVVILVCATLLLAVLQGAPVVLAITDRRPLRYLGRISYGLYMVHPPLQAAWEALQNLLDERLHVHLNHFLSFGLFCAILVLVCHLLYTYFESYWLGLKARLPAQLPTPSMLSPEPPLAASPVTTRSSAR